MDRSELRVVCEYPDGTTQSISEVNPQTASERGLLVAATAVRDVLSESWQKFVDEGHISAQALAQKIRTPEDQMGHMQQKKAQYYLMHETGAIEDSEQVHGFIRVERYRSLLRGRYPNITDLEFRGGQLNDEDTAHYARTLMYHALHKYSPERPVSAYTEAPNQSGVAFFEAHGFKLRNTTQPEVLLPDSHLQYAHMEAAQLSHVLETLPPDEHTYTRFMRLF